MDAAEQINKFTQFFEENYKSQIQKNVQKDRKRIEVDFTELIKFDSDLANELLDFPTETIKAAEIGLQQLEKEGELKDFAVRFTNLTPACDELIANIRAKHTQRLVNVEGIIKGMTDVVGHIACAKFECPSCGNIINVLQLEQNFKEPARCGCGRKGKFRLLDKEVVDAFTILLEEPPDLSEKPNLTDIKVLFKADLTNPDIYSRLTQGLRIKVAGIIYEQQIMTRQGKSNEIIWFIEANNLEIFDEDYTSVEVTPEDQKAIKDYSLKGNTLARLAEQIFSDIEGFTYEKQIITLQAVSGVKLVKERSTERGNLHILLIGDSGVAKTKIIKSLIKVVPKGRYVSGGSSSKVGLGAGVQRDEILGKHYLVAGALPLSHKGLCAIDELDGLSDEDTKMLNEATENQEITINKIVKGTFKTECSVLYGANPKGGKFDEYLPLAGQINLKPALISRCDAILLFRDVPDVNNDAAIARTMLFGREELDELPTEFIRKYIAEASKGEPQMTKEANEYIAKTFVDIRQRMTVTEMNNIPIGFRDINAIRRFAQAHAKVNLKNTVEISDARVAVNLKMFSLSQVAFDSETGTMDVNMLNTGTTISERSLSAWVMEQLDNVVGGQALDIGELYLELNRKRSTPVSERVFEEVLSKLKNASDIFEPVRGKIKKL